MIDKDEVWDVALIAVIQHHGFSCEQNADGSFRARLSNEDFERIRMIYRVDYRPVLSRIRRLRNGLARPAPHAGVPRDGNPVSPRPEGAF